MSYGYLPGARDRIAPMTHAQAIHATDGKRVPQLFPLEIWNDMQGRYSEYWAWFNGDRLNEAIKDKNGNPTKAKKYPLAINVIRNFSRKHAAILLGEESFDSGEPLIKTVVTPKASLKKRVREAPTMPSLNHAQPLPPAPPAPKLLPGQKPPTPEPTPPPIPISVTGDNEEYDQEDRALAQQLEDIINEVWVDSNGRAIQMENAVLSQFLGGNVFQAVWHAPWEDARKEKRIPISIHSIIPDFFLPVWKSNEPWNLLEAYVVYRIPASAAAQQYGVKTTSTTGFVIYVEHWTRDRYSVFLDGVPLTTNINNVKFTFKDVVNPFGFVPFVYIPHMREGSFWGSSICEDLTGLTREYNARLADIGDNMHDTVHREMYVRNLSQDPVPKKLNERVTATNIGNTNGATKEPPEVFAIDPVALPQSATDFADKTLWTQTLRQGDVSDVAYGEDEGSQRSALTLAFRMWPSTAHARMERTYWTEGLNHLARMIIKMIVCKADDPAIKKLGVDIPEDWQHRVKFAQDWLPMIPRDREQLVNEVILLFQSGLMSPQRALHVLGGVDYVDDEISQIMEWMVFQASLGSMGGASTPGDTGMSKSGEGAEMLHETPVAATGDKAE
jgi:hypothetical protein